MVGSLPEHRVAAAVSLQRWDRLTFLHWAYAPAVIADLLPPGLEVDTFDGQAWVGVTPFQMRDVRAPGVPAVPGLSTFPETNVRTYVRNEQGVDGLWFLTLECARAASLAARPILGLPYAWARMDVTQRDGRLRYTSDRRWPAAAATSDYVVRPGEPLAPDALTPFDHWLTGRWRAFSGDSRRLWCTPVEHPPWPLHRAEAERLDGTLVASTGLPAPTRDPVVHFSPGVDVRLGPPRRAR